MSVGKKFADVAMVSTEDGKKKKLSKIAGRGRPVVLLVYSSSQPECAPALQAMEEHAFAHEHVEFLALNVEDDRTATKEFLQAQGVRKIQSYNGRLPKNYDVRDGALPYHIVIDEEGKLALASEDTADYIGLVA